MTGNVFFRLSLVDNITKAAENAEAQCLDMLIPNDVRIQIEDALHDAWNACAEIVAVKRPEAPFYAIVEPEHVSDNVLCRIERINGVLETVWTPAELNPVRGR